MSIIKNMIIIKMNIRISRVVIPFFVAFGVSMAMRAYLSSFLAMEIVMGFVPIILFP